MKAMTTIKNYVLSFFRKIWNRRGTDGTLKGIAFAD
jgi:hypothetical protein